MKTSIEYDPTQWPQRVNLLVMKKAQEWDCSPSKALERLLDALADEEEIPKAAA